MPKFLARVTLNAEGVRLLRQDKGSGRRTAVTRAVEAAGGKVEAFYFAYGQDDTIIIADYPDAASATAMSVAGNSTGVVRCQHGAAHHGRGNGLRGRQGCDGCLARGDAWRLFLSGGTERCYGAGGEDMAPSSLHLIDGVPRCPSRTT